MGRKNSKPQRKMKIPLVLLVACVASLKAASLMDSVFNGPTCQDVCCPASTTTGGETTTAAAGETTTAAAGETTTAAGEGTTTACDCAAFDCDGDSGAGSASMSLLALLLPAVFARLL